MRAAPSHRLQLRWKKIFRVWRSSEPIFRAHSGHACCVDARNKSKPQLPARPSSAHHRLVKISRPRLHTFCLPAKSEVDPSSSSSCHLRYTNCWLSLARDQAMESFCPQHGIRLTQGHCVGCLRQQLQSAHPPSTQQHALSNSGPGHHQVPSSAQQPHNDQMDTGFFQPSQHYNSSSFGPQYSGQPLIFSQPPRCAPPQNIPPPYQAPQQCVQPQYGSHMGFVPPQQQAAPHFFYSDIPQMNTV